MKAILKTKILLLCLGFIFICGTGNAQEGDHKESGMKGIRKNVFYFEVMGNAAVWSVNYERIIPVAEKLGIFLRIGGNEYHGSDTNDLSINIIGATGILYGGPRHFLDTGIGYTYFTGTPDRLIVFSAGYRYQGPKGLVIRATPMYIINTEKGDTFGNSIWGGLSVGYSF